MGEKVKVGFYLPKDLVQKIKRLVMEKYETYERGLLSYEVELALRNWLALHTQAQIKPAKINPQPRVQQVYAQVKQWLLANLYEELYPGQQIPLKHIEQAIAAVRGSDPRTVKKWIKAFRKFHLIKPGKGVLWEVM